MMPAHDDHETLGDLLYEIARLCTVHLSEALKPLGLNYSHYLCLRVIATMPDQSNAELARARAVSPQALNKTLLDLQEAGLVQRPIEPDRYRQRPTRLTARGRLALSKAAVVLETADARMLSCLNEVQRRLLRQSLSALLEGIDGHAVPSAM